MKKIRLRTLFIYALTILSAALLLHTSQSVQKTEDQLAAINSDISNEQDSIRVLKTEWAFLNNPERLETLARQYLKLTPSDPAHIKTDGTEIPVKSVLPPENEMQVQPVAFTSPQATPKPSSKPVPAAALKVPVLKPPLKEKSLNDLVRQVAGGSE